jgi:hypothetical protein
MINEDCHYTRGRMKMKFRVALFVTLLVVLFFAVPVLAKPLNENEKSVPFKAYATGISGPPPSGPPPWGMDVFGSGVATHMGLVTVYQHHLVVPTKDQTVFDFYDGTFDWTAANGDELMGTYSGSLKLNPAGYFEIHGLFVIHGGTGRFQDATGGGPASGAQFPDGTFELRLDGTISYN